MKYDCEIVRDIIPLYVDDCLSNSSKACVEDHVKECSECKAYLESAKKETSVKKEEGAKYQEKTVWYAKKIKKTRQIIVLSFVAICVLAIFVTAVLSINLLSGKYDYKAVAFAKSQDAQAYVERGWIPRELPVDATDIAVYYNLDTNQVNGKFHVPSDTAHKFTMLLTPSSVDDLKNADDGLNHEFKEIKTSLQENYDAASFYKNDTYLFALVSDGTVYYFSI